MKNPGFAAQPRHEEPIAGRDGRISQAWANYFARLATVQTGDDLRQLYEALAARVGDLAEGQTLRIIGRNSVYSAGTSVVEIQLVGDDLTPGNTEYYGTGPDGAKGFFPVADAIEVEAGELSKVVGADGVITLGLADVPDAGGGTLQKTLRDEFGRLAGTSAATTDDLGEGAGNLYYTDSRADARAEVAVAAHVAEADPHTQYTTAAEAAAAAPVQSINGMTGTPVLVAADVGAQPASANLTSWAGIDPATKADDNAVVHLSGAETIVGQKTFDSDLIFSGSSRVFRADFSSGAATRMKVQTSAVDSNTNFTIVPSGITGRQAIISLFNSSDASNASGAQFAANVLEVQFNSVATGAGSLLPWSYKINNVTMLQLETGGAVRPGSDNVQSSGSASNRWSVVYAGSGTINTSDAREKTPVRPLTAAEIAAAVELGGDTGVYQWLAMIEQKGDAAREHIGQTVQRAIAVLESHGLDPFRYGFICYDQWSELPEVLGGDGDVIQEFRPAGDRYSFRMDELLAFIAAGERAARIAANAELHALIVAMEQRLAAAGL